MATSWMGIIRSLKWAAADAVESIYYCQLVYGERASRGPILSRNLILDLGMVA